MGAEPQRIRRWRDHRAEARWRVRLQTAKVFDDHSGFLTDAQFFDRSSHGARLRLAATIVLPRKVLLFDEISKHSYQATVAWQRGQDIGVRIISWSEGAI